jgi:hypothetical protein
MVASKPHCLSTMTQRRGLLGWSLTQRPTSSTRRLRVLGLGRHTRSRAGLKVLGCLQDAVDLRSTGSSFPPNNSMTTATCCNSSPVGGDASPALLQFELPWDRRACAPPSRRRGRANRLRVSDGQGLRLVIKAA